MKRIVINESQYNRLFEARLEGFRLDGLIGKSFAERQRYLTQWLGEPIGKGSARAVYQLDDETVIKLAINQKGIAQNEYEYNTLTSYYRIDLFPEVYNGSDETNYLWIIMQYVLPAKKEDFRNVLNMEFSDVDSFIRGYEYSKSNGYLRDFGWKQMQMIYKKYENNYAATELLNNLNDFGESFEGGIGDLTRIVNWGLTSSDGQPYLVALDAGLSNAIYDDYYRR